MMEEWAKFASWCCACLVAQSCLTLMTPQTVASQAPPSMGFSRQECWSGLPCLPPGDLPNPGLLHCRWILYRLRHQGSPRIPEWVASLFSRGSSQPRNQTRVSCIAGGFFYQLSYQGRPLPDDKQLKKADIVYETTDFGQYAAQECDPRQK